MATSERVPLARHAAPACSILLTPLAATRTSKIFEPPPCPSSRGKACRWGRALPGDTLEPCSAPVFVFCCSPTLGHTIRERNHHSLRRKFPGGGQNGTAFPCQGPSSRAIASYRRRSWTLAPPCSPALSLQKKRHVRRPASSPSGKSYARGCTAAPGSRRA